MTNCKLVFTSEKILCYLDTFLPDFHTKINLNNKINHVINKVMWVFVGDSALALIKIVVKTNFISNHIVQYADSKYQVSISKIKARGMTLGCVHMQRSYILHCIFTCRTLPFLYFGTHELKHEYIIWFVTWNGTFRRNLGDERDKEKTEESF